MELNDDDGFFTTGFVLVVEVVVVVVALGFVDIAGVAPPEADTNVEGDKDTRTLA